MDWANQLRRSVGVPEKHMTLAELLAEKRAVRDRIDNLNELLSGHIAEDAALNEKILSAMTAQGMTGDGAKLSAGGMTVTRRTKWRASYEPEKWEGVVRWALDSGHVGIFHRRLTDSRVMELFDSGIGLPDGLSVKSYPALDFRKG